MYFGSLKGYSSTLFFNHGGFFQLNIDTFFSTEDDAAALNSYLQKFHLKSLYHIYQFHIENNRIIFIWNFLPNAFSADAVTSFIEWFFPLLGQYKASGTHICTMCGKEIVTKGHWYLMARKSTARHIHSDCRSKLMQEDQRASAFFRKNKMPSSVYGFLWALLFNIPGIVLWSTLVHKNDVVVVVGILLGLLGWLGYTFAPGRRGGRKLLILLATIILCELLGSGISALFCCLTHAPIESSYIFARSLLGFFFSLVLLVTIHIVETCTYHSNRREGLTGIVDLE